MLKRFYLNGHTIWFCPQFKSFSSINDAKRVKVKKVCAIYIFQESLDTFTKRLKKGKKKRNSKVNNRWM